MKKMTLSDFVVGFEAFLIKWENIEGCIISDGASKKDVRKMREKGTSIKDTEMFCNHYHVLHLLDTMGLENVPEMRNNVADLFAGVIDRRLKRRFPQMKFVIEVTPLPQEEDIIITYFHETEEGQANIV